MRKIIIVIICLTLFSVFSVNAFAQTLHVDVNMDKLTKIKDSKYIASSLNVLRNSNGDLISVVTTNASKYLPDPKTDQVLDVHPILKKGILNEKKIEMRQLSVEYNYQECITKTFAVPGYTDQCNWYHRGHVTSLSASIDGEPTEIFRGLNHSYIIKPGDSVTSFWTVIRSD